MERGWIRLWRKIQDDPLWTERREFSKAEAWIDILMEVRHEEKSAKVLIKNEVLICQQGESVYSLDTWARRWHWNRSKVRRFFELLKKMQKIDTVPCSKATHLKVLNYSNYNKRRNADETQMKRKRNASETQTTTNKNDNNDKNVKKTTYNTFSKLKKNKEKVLKKATELYPHKKTRQAMKDFMEAAEIKGYRYQRWDLAFYRWVREDRFDKYDFETKKKTKAMTKEELKKKGLL